MRWVRAQGALRHIGMRDLGSTQSAGALSAVLFILCGLLVAASAPLAGEAHAHPLTIAAIGLLASLSGVVMMAMPWHAWPRARTLWLVPLAFALIGLHNWATGAEGYRYGVFFFVVAAWVGLMHPRWTTLAVTPGMLAAYVVPALFVGDVDEVVSSLTYAIPVFLLIGECASLVAERVRSSEAELRSNEERFRALVQNSADAIMVVDAEAKILWESPGITTILGYAPDERAGTNGMDYVHPEFVHEIGRVLGSLLTDPQVTCRVELQLQHKDGTWRWCEAVARNLLDLPAVGGLVVNLADVTERHRAYSIQRRLAAIVESSSDAIVGQALDGTVLSWNGAAEAMYGYSAGDMIGKNICRIIPDDRVNELASMIEHVASGESINRVTTQRCRRDGELLDVSLSLSPVRNSAGDVVSVAGIARDITAETRAAQAIADSESSFRLLFSANPQPMWVYETSSYRFLEVNEAAVRHYGYSREQFLTMSILDIRPPEDVDRMLAAAASEQMARETTGWRHRLADGRVIDVDVSSHRLLFAGRDAVLVAALDITDRNALEGQLRHQAFHDSLTGLSNRALFYDRVEHALGRRDDAAGPVVLLLDLDRFKLVNDSLGHAVGDDLLVAVAHRLQEAVRSGDTVARLGGDEFAILLEQCSSGRAERHATRLLEAVAQPLELSGQSVDVTGSIGIAAGDPGLGAGELLRNADMAMYRAKAAGGGCFRMFEPEMHVDAMRELEVTAALRAAIDDQRFVLHYQPVVSACDGTVVAMEALVRWRRDNALVAPGEFIPALEASGLIVGLGEWILQRACMDAMAWPEHLSVNVNLSARQLLDDDLVPQVSRALQESGLAPGRLMLEITESVLMHAEGSMQRLTELRALGVGLAIDDFGTGYSSLSYLRAFRIDELKIDRSFIDSITEDSAAVSLVATIIQLARSLSLTSVAEGVETREQYQLLRELGCDRLQGYFFARPAPVDDVVVELAS
jgi:diguanylate cyclase (GGDEF)-like protein/PAS domain S-box-containing protein